MSETPLARELRRAVVASGAYVFADAVARGVSFALTLLFTRYLLPEELGVVAIAGTVTLLLTPTLVLSVGAGLSRIYFEAATEAERRELMRSILGFALVVPTALVSVIEALGDAGLLDFFPHAPYAPYLRYAVLAAYFAAYVDLVSSLLITQRRPRRVVALAGVNAGSLLVLGVVLVMVRGEGAIGVLRATTAANALAAALAVALLWRSAGGVRISRRWLTPALAISIPLITESLAQWILQVSDRPVLSHYVTAGQVGVYYIGYSVAASAGLAVHGAGRALLPTVAEHLKAEQDERLVRIGTYWFGALVAVCLVVALAGRDILALVAPTRYSAALPVVPVVAFSYVFFAAWAIVFRPIWYSMRTRLVPLLTLAAGALNVGLNVLMIPRYGIMAAAWDTVAGFCALAVLTGLAARRLHRIDWEYVRWLKILLAALAAFGVAQLAGTAPSLGRLGLELAAVIVVGPLVLLALGFPSAEERALVAGRRAA